MEGNFSPIVKKIAGEVVGKGKRDFRAPTDVCLEDWWLLKPNSGKGLAVGGRPVEMRRCDNARKEFHSAPTKKRYASREFHSTQVVKRHSCTTVETSDGIFVYLSGFINRSRTQQNGFPSEVCRDFLYGFPLNWEDHASNCVGEESSQSNLEYFSESFLPAALDAYNGAQLHDMMLSLTDAEREIVNKKMYDNIMILLNQEKVNETSSQLSMPNPPSPVIKKNIITPSYTMTKVKNKRQRISSMQNQKEQEVGGASVSSSTTAENWPGTSDESKTVDVSTSGKRVCRTVTKLENHGTEENVPISSKASVKLGLMEKPASKIQTSRKSARGSVTKPKKAEIEKNVNVSPKASVKLAPMEKPASKIQTSRKSACGSVTKPKKPEIEKPKKPEIEKNVNVSPKACVKKGTVDKHHGVTRASSGHLRKSMSNLENSSTGENVVVSPKASEEQRALRAAKRSILTTNSKGKTNVEGRKTCDQSDVRQLLETLTAVGQKQKGKCIRMLKELLY